jgi:maltooligosyltrehalose trehalohydrolase
MDTTSHEYDPLALTLGARYLGNGRCAFRVWAPRANQVELHVLGGPSTGIDRDPTTPVEPLPAQERMVTMQPEDEGYFAITLDGVEPGALYRYRLDDVTERPDPASRFQPHGVHGPSAVVDPDFAWSDDGWTGLPLEQYVVYELHVGTFTPEGTFEAIIPQLGYLKELGVTAVELLPVAQFPGNRNWGYDGTYPYAPQNSYGGPHGLKSLVDACHAAGLAVILDVVYNHLGPEGNYTQSFGPYFTDRYRNIWGDALNFDGPDSDGVRRFFIENALYWMTEFHVDAFRFDAIDTVVDIEAQHFIADLTLAIHSLAERQKRRVYAIGELGNRTRYIRPREQGGYGLDAQWADELHHAVHALLTGDRAHYYAAYGELDHVERALRDAYVYTGQYSPTRKRRYGDSTAGLPGWKFVVCTQNHDQVGNRMFGERLSHLLDWEPLKLAAGIVLLSPYIPLLWMGEEYAESAPFQYFISHGDSDLVRAVQEGRKEEFAGFFETQGEPPDPAAEETFQRSKVNLALHNEGCHRVMWRFYQTLLRLRRELPALAALDRERLEVARLSPTALMLRRWTEDGQQAALAFSVSEGGETVGAPLPAGQWHKVLASDDPQWHKDATDDADAPTPPLESDGTLNIELGPMALVVLAR